MPIADVSLTARSSSSISAAVEMMEALRYSARITGYKIRYLRSGTSSWVTNTYSTSAHTYTRTYNNLDPYTRYYVQATVIISGISSDAWSTTRYVTTAEASESLLASLKVHYDVACAQDCSTLHMATLLVSVAEDRFTSVLFSSVIASSRLAFCIFFSSLSCTSH